MIGLSLVRLGVNYEARELFSNWVSPAKNEIRAARIIAYVHTDYFGMSFDVMGTAKQ